MKNDLFYFVVSSPKNKYVFGCNFKEMIMLLWIGFPAYLSPEMLIKKGVGK
jgi:hypothetical protein